MAGMVSLQILIAHRNEMQKFHVLLLLQCVFEGTTRQVPRIATFGDRQLGDGVAPPTKVP